MLNNQTLEQLKSLKLTGMVEALCEQQMQSCMSDLDFDSRLGLLVEREYLKRDDRRLQRRLRSSRFPIGASMENINYTHNRGLNKAAILEMAHCNWVRNHLNVLITGSTGCGKTYLACALAHKSCLIGYNVRYYRLPRLWSELKIAKADGSYHQWLSQTAKVDVLILDDWGLVQPDVDQRRDLLEILDDRYQNKTTIVTSQLPVTSWYEHLNDETLADAILDRLLHNSIKIELSGESLRKEKKILQTEIDAQ